LGDANAETNISDMRLDEVATEVVADPTPPSIRGALDVVARHGHLTPEKLGDLSGDELAAIERFIGMDRPDLLERLASAKASGDELAFLVWLIPEMCGWLNFRFDQESAAKLRTLPEKERESFRALPVNPQTWRQLHTSARWHSGPRRFRHEVHCPALRIRRGGQRTRRVQHRRVASSRRARAPGRLDEPDPPLGGSGKALAGGAPA
jgi:hypothetical protein